MKTKTIPVVIGTLGVIKKRSKKYLDDIPANILLQYVQKTTLLGTAHILRGILSINEMKCRCFRPLFCTMKAELGRGQLGLMR